MIAHPAKNKTLTTHFDGKEIIDIFYILRYAHIRFLNLSYACWEFGFLPTCWNGCTLVLQC
jgi:hypothetical protein